MSELQVFVGIGCKKKLILEKQRTQHQSSMEVLGGIQQRNRWEEECWTTAVSVGSVQSQHSPSAEPAS